METKTIIIIGILLVVICALCAAIFGALTSNVDYERIEITPNGTSIEVPINDANYEGEINNTGAKMWTFKQGALMTFNSEEAIDARGITGLGGAVGFKDIKDIVLTHFEKQENIDGFTVYTLNGEQLGINGRGTLYCIMTGNDETHDNIIIAADNKDIALHMAKSIQYKAGNTTVNANMTNSEEVSADTSTASSTPTSNENKNPDNSAKPNTATGDDGYVNMRGEDDTFDYSTHDSSNVETTTDDSSSSSSSYSGSSSESSDSSSKVETTTG